MKLHINGIDREMNENELAEYQALFDGQISIDESIKQREALRSAALSKLGLTADEVVALFG